ncbi:septum site-determining protein MinC [Anaerolentibacter hominis]|uniref:septum site-determining protein MinC n=1 Tax=Anaerolentibacter hominis TaxID=3079009 RepID=UPI0031B86749
MDNSVMIKGTKSGIILVLDEDTDFEILKENIAAKFAEAARFFGNAQVVLSFEGRRLTNEEQRDVLDTIENNSDLRIVCIVDAKEENERLFKKTLEDKLMELGTNSGQFFKGNLRKGQVAEFDTSVIFLGDVYPDAKIISKGNIVILGSLEGEAFAGASGNHGAFIVAMDMQPQRLRIGDLKWHTPQKRKINLSKKTKIAFAEEGEIHIEVLSRNALNKAYGGLLNG